QRMTAARELVDGRVRIARLDMQRVARLAEGEGPGEPGGEGGRLVDVLAKIDHRDVSLHVDLWLAVRPHAADHRPELVVLECERGDQCMQWNLAGLEAVGMPRVEREVRAAVLHDHAGLARSDSGAEYAVQAENQGGRISLRVHRRDVHRVAGEAPLGRDLVPRQR